MRSTTHHLCKLCHMLVELIVIVRSEGIWESHSGIQLVSESESNTT